MAAVNGGAKDTKPPWAALKVERRALGKLKPYERNSRTHTAEQIAEVAKSIETYGFTMPILIDEGDGIVAGHARAAAAGLLKLAEVPVVVARGWSDQQKREYIIADNKIGLNSGWDWDLLAIEVSDLRALGSDLSVIGFTELEVANLLAEPTAHQQHLANSDPAEDATWPTLELKMPPAAFDQIRAALDGVAGDLPDWRRLMLLMNLTPTGDGGS
jgi:ParB-like chromosome segregation protein Spo0J